MKEKVLGLIKNKRAIAVLVAVLVVIYVVLMIADVFGIGFAGKETAVEIPSGAGSGSISKILKKNDIIGFPWAFKVCARLDGDVVYQKGYHFLRPGMSYREIIDKLCSAPDVSSERTKKLVIPEGFELRQIGELLEKEGIVSAKTFLAEAQNGTFDYDFVSKIPNRENRLEGYLYPETYIISQEESAHSIIDLMLKTFNERVVPVYEQSGTEKSLDEIIILASVIEREAANDEERPLVASVFTNRIRIGQKLESCATVQYILGERKDVLSLDDIAIDSPYNTYIYQGLPVGPIAVPGIKSIEAALHPADTDYLYFVAEEDGSGNRFSRNFAEHNQKTVEIQGN